MADAIGYLRRSSTPGTIEIIVVDGGSVDSTLDIAKQHADKVLELKRAARGTQQHEGAMAANGEVLLFLHADTRLPENWESILIAAWQTKPQPAATAFRMRFEKNSFVYRFIAWGAWIRSQFTGIPHGDQGIAVSRDLYFRVGGFPQVPLMEEYYLGRKLCRYGDILFFPERIIASTRRYEKNGPLYNAFRNAFLIGLHYLGASPECLLRLYERSKSGVFLAIIIFSLSVGTYGFNLSQEEWNMTLRKYNHHGFVNYLDMKDSRSDLENYLKSLSAVSEDEYRLWKENEKIAFWINAYNACTVKAILDHYPIKASLLKSALFPKNSIRQIDGVWDKLEFNVMGKPLTLDAIEHKILRGKFKEPRIHMALVCGARGCPPLREESFSGEKLEAQLEDQTAQFLSNSEKYRIDRDDRTVFLSPIFDWFGADFIPKYGTEKIISGKDQKEKAVLNFISHHVPSPDREYLKEEKFQVKYLDYDWTLNDRTH